MQSLYVLETVLVLCIAAIAYHHVGYPILLRTLAHAATRRGLSPGAGIVEPIRSEALPTITIIVPAHNEQDVIAAKIENVAGIDYPSDRLTVVIALDGCTDETRAVAADAIRRLGDGRDIRLVEYTINRGKIAVLNEQIEAARTEIVALNDASGMIDKAALRKAAQHFADQRTGVVCATYRHPAAGSAGEAVYWRLQTQMMAYEAAVAAPMGAHGALYFIRRALWQPLPPDTINDDFVMPMQIVAAGYRSVYDPAIVATEVEPTASAAEFRRRVRIGAGNMQQLVRLIGKVDPLRMPGVAFLFLSGKGLRPFVPFLILLAVLATLLLALRGETLFSWLLAIQLLGLGIGAGAAQLDPQSLPRPLAWLSYLVLGHTASALGAVAFVTGFWHGPWRPSSGSNAVLPPTDCPRGLARTVAVSKRIVDIIGALAGLVLLVLLWVPIAIAIKLESRGPVHFRQIRVGRSTPAATHLFELIKFRSMRDDAERGTGPVFAGRNDERITRVGSFLRRTRLDELPQFVNVLKGDMSLVGPRPERPYFVRRLHEEMPFYAERTLGLRPGLTGLAQVHQSYDQSVNDVSMKVAYDHAYAIRLSRSVKSWLRTDLEVLLKTLVVVCRRTGQ